MSRVIRIVLISFISRCLLAQGLPHEIRGPMHRDVSVPNSSGKAPGQRDEGAVIVLTQYAETVGGNAWNGMTANGIISYGGANEMGSATLSMLPGGRARLDTKAAEADSSIVVHRTQGRASYMGKPAIAMTPATALAGIVPFDLPIAVLQSNNAESLIDRGIVAIDGVELHRISIEITIKKSDIWLPGGRNKAVLDCYFDPDTHLLQMSASVVEVPGYTQSQMLRVITYSSYQTVGSMQIPHAFSETINGQQTWSMTLTSIDIGKLPPSAMF